jgi:hypothetical protein
LSLESYGVCACVSVTRPDYGICCMYTVV